MFKKKSRTFLFFLFLCFVLPLTVLKSSCASGAAVPLAAAAGKPRAYNAYKLLKNITVRTYLKQVPLKFVKYFHFNDFVFTAANINTNYTNSYSIKPEISNARYSGWHTVLIKFLDKKDGRLKGVAYVTFKTEIYAPVAAASRTIGKFQVIKPEDVKISYRNIPALSDGYFLNKKNAAGREAKFIIAQNAALTKADTERKRIINFGSRVNIVYKRFGLILKTSGTALQSGALDSPIRVRNAESGAVINCIVKSDKTVAVR